MTTIVLPIILVIGLLTNIAFIYVTLRIKHMRIVINIYLVNLAIANVVFLGAAIGDKLWKYLGSPVLGDDSPLGSNGCIWLYFLIDMAYFASLIFITAVALCRYFAVCRPHGLNYFKSHAKIFVVASWLLAGGLAASIIPAYSDTWVYCFQWPDVEPYQDWPSVIRFCAPIQTWIGDYSAGLQSIPFFIALVVNLFIYVSIILRLKQWTKKMSYHGINNKADISARRQLTLMLVVNGIAFFCLLAPFEFLSLFRMIASLRGGESGYFFLITNPDVRSHLAWAARICSYINSVLNPIIYTVMCSSYRKAFKQAFLPSCCVDKQELQQVNTSEIPAEVLPTKSNTLF